MKKNYFLHLLILLLPLRIFSQLSVAPNAVATQLAQAITGSGVTVSSASLNCGNNGAGTFSYSGSTLGLSNGIILTTGHASDASLPAQIVSVSTGNNFSDPNLVSIEAQAKKDNCILTFSFVPVCSQVSITYEFGSSEYDGYQCSQYNDAFGIFLTGPNPGGGNYTATNIATLPNGTAVSINNVNDGSSPCTSAHNPTYFIDNSLGTDVVYEGLTTAITSTRSVVPCSTYFMKIAIADAGDELFDSGVFIGGNAVNCSTAPSASITSTPVACGGSNGTASVTFSNFSGTPTYSWSPGGQATSSLSSLSAGTYTCVVGFATGCSGVFTQTLTTTVANTGSNLSVSTAATPANCSNTPGSATVTITGGTSPYTISWSSAPSQTTTVANNLMPGSYTVSVQDQSGCFQTSSVNIGVNNPVTLQSSNVSVCGNNLVLNAASGTAYQWYDTSNVIILGATSSTYSATGISNGQHYIVSYKDNTTGCRDSMEINISQYFINFSSVSSPACHGGSIGSLNFSSSGTYTFSAYDWALTGVSTNSASAVPAPISISNLAAGSYTVIITQAGNPSCAYMDTITISSTTQPATASTFTVCNLDTLKLNPSISSGSTNNWYLSSQLLGIAAANTTFTVSPPLVDGSIYTDSISDANNCKSVLNVYILLESFIPTVSIIKQAKCFNDSIGQVKITVPRENNGPINEPYSFNWQYPSPYTSPATVNAGSTVPVSSTESNLHPGTYYCVIKAGNCTDTVSFTLLNPPKLNPDSIYAYYCPKDSLALLVADTGNVNYVWHPSNAVVSVTGDSAHVLVQNINNYYVTYMHNGCADTAKTMVAVTTYDAFRPDELVNVFSPNGDKANDFFYPFYQRNLSQYEISKQSDTYELHVYDRWGKSVYDATDYNKPWDGKTKSGHDADDGTYFFVVKYKSNCASKADLVEKKGFVVLTR